MRSLSKRGSEITCGSFPTLASAPCRVFLISLLTVICRLGTDNPIRTYSRLLSLLDCQPTSGLCSFTPTLFFYFLFGETRGEAGSEKTFPGLTPLSFGVSPAFAWPSQG